MSRCFPFLREGYERRITKADGPDILKKEKHKEKKHRKEKGDRDKKEGKEKREKERSDEKHSEKKYKKEKHRDKKKDKEKDRDRDRDRDKFKGDSFPSDDRRVVGPPGGHLSKPAERRMERERERETDTSATLAKNSVAEQFVFPNGEQFGRNSHQVAEAKNHLPSPESRRVKYAPELGQRIVDKERKIINQLPDYNLGTQSKNNEVSKLGGNSTGPLLYGKERSKEKEKAFVDGRIDGGSVVEGARLSGSGSAPTSAGMVQITVGGVGRPMAKKIGRRVEGKQQELIIKDGDDRKGDKQIGSDRERSIPNFKVREFDEKAKTRSEQKHLEQSRVKDGSENWMEFSSAQSIGNQNIRRDANSGAISLDNRGKRKDIGLNGISDEHTTVPNKLARTTTSAHVLMENGRNLEPCQNPTIALAPGTQRHPMNIKVDRTFASDGTQRPPINNNNCSNNNKVMDGKEYKINGLVTQPPNQQQPSQSTAAKAERKAGKTASRPPHPDTKYLTQVLSVPKMDELCDFDDQDWLFNSSSSSQTIKMPEVEESCGSDKTWQQAWDKALWLEPVDVYALPYVIPR